MSVAVFCRILRSRWHNFARLVWPQTSREWAESELDRLKEELRRRHHRLLHCRQKIEELRDSLERRQRSLRLLASTGAGSAERLARRQRTLERLHDRLRERERAYERLRLRFRRRMRLRAHLRDQLLSPLLARGARHDEIESDPDYPF